MVIINRKLTSQLRDALQAFPVVYVNGPRQAGKSTLVQQLAAKQWPAEYVTFDEATMMSAAAANPESFLRAYSSRVIFDEVQMVPDLFRALKILVDEARFADKKAANGRYLLTGSANIMALPTLSDALVGRMRVLTLYPLSVLEVIGAKDSFIKRLMTNQFKPATVKGKISVVDAMHQATFPEITDQENSARSQWFEAYITTILQRDVRQIADIAKLGVLPNLLKVLASRAGGLISEADLSRSIGQNAVTTKSYRILLQMMFLTFDVKPWYRNIGKRLVKAPKGYLVDTALLCHLLQVDIAQVEKNNPEMFGHIFENFVASELLKQLSSMSNVALGEASVERAPELYHFRTSNGKEVDFVLEQADGKLAAIEVKSRDAVDATDFKGLKTLRELVGDDFICGIVLYRGTKIIPFDNNLWAVPIDVMWR